MAVKFRNIDADPSAPVETWGFEGLLAAVDRGSLAEWRRIIAAVRADPYGEVAETLADVLDLAQDPGVVAAMRLAVEHAREDSLEHDRRIVASRMSELVDKSGLDQGTFARRIGTSRTRLNTYLSGKVTPSAAVLVRAERLADSAGSISR